MISTCRYTASTLRNEICISVSYESKLFRRASAMVADVKYNDRKDVKRSIKCETVVGREWSTVIEKVRNDRSRRTSPSKSVMGSSLESGYY